MAHHNRFKRRQTALFTHQGQIMRFSFDLLNDHRIEGFVRYSKEMKHGYLESCRPIGEIMHIWTIASPPRNEFAERVNEEIVEVSDYCENPLAD